MKSPVQASGFHQVSIPLAMATRKEEPRNIIVLGKTGAGKSSIMNAVCGAEVFQVRDPTDMESCTDKPRLEESSFIDNGVQYNMKLIDTVGLFDTKKKSNKQIMREIRDFCKDRVSEGLCLILFVIRNDAFTDEQFQAFKLIKDKLKATMSEISGVVITGCEGMTDDSRVETVRKFRASELTRDVAAFSGKGILPVGFPPLRGTSQAWQQALLPGMKADAILLRRLVMDSKIMELPKDVWETEWCSYL